MTRRPVLAARDGPSLLLLDERSWRRLDGHELLPLGRAGVSFEDGIRVERDDGQEAIR